MCINVSKNNYNFKDNCFSISEPMQKFFGSQWTGKNANKEDR